jgi:hypothetical protein
MKKGIMASRIALLMAGAACGVALAAGPGTRVKVVDEGKLAGQWTAADHASFDAPGYPAEFAGRGDDVCLAIGYRIGRDGRTSDFSVLREWNSAAGDVEPVPGYFDTFAQAGANAISVWRFAPRDGVPVRDTYTVSTVAFTGGGSAEDVRAHCKVDDLSALVQARQSEYYMAYSREKRDSERYGRVFEDARVRAAAAAASHNVTPPPPPPPPAPSTLAAR